MLNPDVYVNVWTRHCGPIVRLAWHTVTYWRFPTHRLNYKVTSACARAKNPHLLNGQGFRGRRSNWIKGQKIQLLSTMRLVSKETSKNCHGWLYFKSSWRGIGLSFQPAIITSQLDFIDYDIASAKEYRIKMMEFGGIIWDSKNCHGAPSLPLAQGLSTTTNSACLATPCPAYPNPLLDPTPTQPTRD